MNARRSIRARWCSMAVLIAFAATLFVCSTASAATQSIDGDPIDVSVFDAGRIEPYYDNQYQYYNAKACNNVLWLNGISTGFDAPDTSTADCSACTDFTAVSNSKPDAWTIETVYDAGSTGVRITQRVEYVNGAKYYRMKWSIENTGSSTYTDLRFMHGGDTYFGGIDSSNGAYDSGLDMVYLTNSGVTGIMGLLGTPSSPIDHYYETNYGGVQNAICNGAHLPDTVNTGYVDAGYAVEWDRTTLAPGQTWEIESVEKWTSAGDVQVFAPAGQSGYVGDTFDYSFSVQNLQSSSDTFDLSTSSSKGWTVSLPGGGTVTIGAGSSETVLVGVTATSVGTDLTTLTATSQAHSTVTNDDSVTTHANPQELSPDITSHTPGSPVTDTYGSWRTFTVSVSQTVDVAWYLDEALQHTNAGVTEASYTFYADDISEHSVSAVASNAYGADTQTWVWNVTPAAIDHFTVTGITDPVAVWETTSPVVTAYDSYNNVKTDYTGTIHFTSTDGSATLPVDYQFVGGTGVHTFTDGVTLKTVGERSVTVTGDAKTGSQTGITVTPAAIDHFTVTGITDPVAVWETTSPVVTAYDAYNNVKTDYTGTITFTSTDGNATLPAAYTFVGGNNGVHTFANGVTLKTVGEQNVTVTDADTKTGSQTGITVTPGAIDYFNVTGITDPVVAGVPTSPVVTAYDAYDNVKTDYTGTIHFTSTDGSATLPADYTFKETDGGTKTFANGVTLKTVGERSVTVTGDTKTGSQTGITVTMAAMDHFNVAGITDPVAVWETTSPTVTACDAYNNVETDYVGTINFTSTDGNATLPGNYKFEEADSGTKTFTNEVILKTVGEQNVTVTDADYKTGSQTGITATHAAIDHLIVAGITDPITSTTTSGVNVTAKDEYGNTVLNYAGTIHFTTTDYSSDALLPDDYTFEPTDEGAKAFDGATAGQVVKLVTISEQTVTATDTVKSAVTGSQTVIVQTNAVTSYDINLVPGWNLISTPLIPDNSSIEAVLSGMTRVTAVYTYDALTATWLQYTHSVPQYATLTHITAEKGYWFMMNASETWTINGSFLGPGGATPPEYPAYIGWNLIGFHSLSADIPYDYLSNVRGHYASEMYGYENGLWMAVSDTNVVNGTDNLEPGYGYWLYMEQNGTITP